MSSYARCIYCNSEDSTNYMVPVSLKNRGGRIGYMCNCCAGKVDSYYDKNNENKGKTIGNPCTYGIELETMHSSYEAKAHLYQYRFLPTYDCTVDIEYKSPVFQNMKSIPHLCKEIEKMMNTRDLIIDSNCGTHFHVGYRGWINEWTMRTIYRDRAIYTRLFSPLSEVVNNDPERAREIFGRAFQDTQWAYPIRHNSWVDTHENFINVMHDNTFEFRLMFFKNANQYMRGVRLCDKITKCIVENLGMHYDDISSNTDKLMKRVDLVAKKLVKLYEKA